jgi:type III secretion protein HrpB1
MTPQLNRKQFVACLIEVISAAISHDRLEDAEAVLGGVRVLRPKLDQLDTFEAWIAIKRGRWQDALLIMNSLDASTPDWPLGKALLAFCQFATGDSSWSARADEVLQSSPTGAAAGLVKLLKGQDPDASEPAQFDDDCTTFGGDGAEYPAFGGNGAEYAASGGSGAGRAAYLRA